MGCAAALSAKAKTKDMKLAETVKPAEKAPFALTVMMLNGVEHTIPGLLPDVRLGELILTVRQVIEAGAQEEVSLLCGEKPLQDQHATLLKLGLGEGSKLTVTLCESGESWHGEIGPYHASNGVGKCIAIMYVTGRTIDGREEVVPGAYNEGIDRCAFYMFNRGEASGHTFKKVKGFALPKGVKPAPDDYAGYTHDPVRGYKGVTHLGICKSVAGDWITGDIIDGTMYYGWWGVHTTKDFQYVNITHVTKTLNTQGWTPERVFAYDTYKVAS